MRGKFLTKLENLCSELFRKRVVDKTKSTINLCQKLTLIYDKKLCEVFQSL